MLHTNNGSLGLQEKLLLPRCEDASSNHKCEAEQQLAMHIISPDGGDLLHNICGRVQVDQALVDPAATAHVFVGAGLSISASLLAPYQ
jgi:hypothetical protein